MKTDKVNLSKLSFSITLLSVAIVAFQLSLIQILSVVQWYHFAYMVISIALLGFGTAGTFLALFRKPLLENAETILPVLMTLSGLFMALSVSLSQSWFVRFDSYRLFAEYTHVWQLILTYVIFFLPFFFGALAIGIIFVKYVDRIGSLYFANMLGSGLGGITAVALMWFVSPQNLPPLISVLALFAGLIALPQKLRPGFTIIVAVFFAILSYLYINPAALHLSEYKSLSKSLNLPDTKVIKTESSPYGLIDIISSPHIRYAPGLSIKYPAIVPTENAAFVNGDWFGPLISVENDTASDFLNYTTELLPYVLGKRNDVLILGSATGRQILMAIQNDASRIDAVEPNKALTKILIEELPQFVDSVYSKKTVRPKSMSTRTYLIQTYSKYDLIALPIVGSFGGTAGLFALQEEYILTKEAFNEMFSALDNNGVICISTWIDYPYRNPLKILSTLVEMLSARKINMPGKYIVAIKNWNTITFVLKKSQFTEYESDKVREFCDEMNFDPVLLPVFSNEERSRYNKLQDTLFFNYIDIILSSQAERNKLYSEYAFNIKPATDDNPYFSQFLKWDSIPQLAELFGSQALPFFEIGYLLLYITFVQIILLAFVLIIVPLFKIGWKGEHKFRTLFFFSGLGIGYMFVEVIFIQRFTLYFGNVIYAAATVVGLMLISSGFGSLVSQKITAKPNRLIGIILIVTVLIILYAFVLSSLLRTTIIFSLTTKIIFSTLLIAPPAFFMGMPFPLGLRLLSTRSELQLPWAWGINGVMSVISTALAIIVAVELGFVWVMIFAAGAYSLSLLVNLRNT